MKVGDIVNTKSGWKGIITDISYDCDGIKYSKPIATVEQAGSDKFIVVNENNLVFDDVLSEYNQVIW